MKYSEFKQKIEGIYAAKFGKALCVCKIYGVLGAYIGIDCYLAANRSEMPHGIAENDVLQIKLSIDLPEGEHVKLADGAVLPDGMTISAIKHSIKTKPPQAMRYLYCDFKNISFRKTTGSAEKLLKTFERFINRLYTEIEKQYKDGNLLSFDEELFKRRKGGE